METKQQYEDRAQVEAQRHLQEIERAPLSDRKEACADFLRAMASDPALVGERIGWLFDGNYGYGEMLLARRIVMASSRTNKRAQLTHLIGALEWQCPVAMAAASWKKLTKRQQQDLDAVLDTVLATALDEIRSES